jgi:hypothetical protein
MNILGLLQGVVQGAAAVFSLFHGKKPTLTEILPAVATTVFSVIDQAQSYGNLSTKEQIDSWLDTYDQTTGSEPGAVDLAPSMPKDKEEEMLDHVKEAARLYAYNRAKVAGYVL